VSDEWALRQKARDAIMAGRLPTYRPTGVWGGPGTGNSCAVCAQAITADGLGFELEFAEEDTGQPEIRNVHLWCFAAWEFECRSFLPAPDDGVTILGRERDDTHKHEPG
jgi:hypothetical protein